MTPARALVAEFLGTALLLATVVGSGIMGERLAGGNQAIALMANAVATGAGLVALISCFGPASGAHFNPLVTLADLVSGRMAPKRAGEYILVQLLGAITGVVAAHLMFELSPIMIGQHVRTGGHQWWSEMLASFGLLTVILNVARSRPESIPVVVGCYITAAYWFTASTSFANPAVTLARSLTDSFSGIRLIDVPGFVLSQLAGCVLALLLDRWIGGSSPKEVEQSVEAAGKR